MVRGLPVASGQLPWGPVVLCWLIVHETEFLLRVQLTLPLGVVNPLSSMALLGAGALKVGVAEGVGVGVGVCVGVGVLLGLADGDAVGVPSGVWFGDWVLVCRLLIGVEPPVVRRETSQAAAGTQGWEYWWAAGRQRLKTTCENSGGLRFKVWNGINGCRKRHGQVKRAA